MVLNPSQEATVETESPYWSIVLPVFNEEGNLPVLYERLTKVLQDTGRSYELVFVDDGSRDNSYALLEQLHADDPCVRVLKFSRNFGHHIAVTAGLDHTRGEVVVLMDSDLQDQPEEILTLWRKLEEGYDVVYGLRRNKKFSWLKRSLASLFRWVMRRVLRYEVPGGIFRMLRRPVVEEFRRCREVDRLVVGLIRWVGFRQIGVEVEHGARMAGETKYTLGKQIQLALNSITAFSVLPLKLASWLGFAASLLGFLGVFWIVARKLVWGLGILGWSSLMVTVIFFSGVQLLCIGILGEYLARVFTETRRRPLYVIETFLNEPETGSNG